MIAKAPPILTLVVDPLVADVTELARAIRVQHAGRAEQAAHVHGILNVLLLSVLCVARLLLLVHERFFFMVLCSCCFRCCCWIRMISIGGHAEQHWCGCHRDAPGGVLAVCRWRPCFC